MTPVWVYFFITLHLDNLSLRGEKLKAGLMFKTLNTPSYLQDMFSFRGPGYNIRNSEIRLNLPKPRRNYLKRGFCYSGAILWNSLPQDISPSSAPLFPGEYKNSSPCFQNLAPNKLVFMLNTGL